MQNYAWLSIAAIIISFITLLINYIFLIQKMDQKIVGDYRGVTSIYSKEPYIERVILSNQKDKSVAIFAIYFQLYANNFIELKNYEEKPLIIEPYSTVTVVLGPIQGYRQKSREKVDLTKILFSKDGKKYRKIVLATSKGRYKVKSKRLIWSPDEEMQKRYFTETLYPIYRKFKGILVGDNTTYILEFKNPDEILLIDSYFDCDYHTIKGIKLQPTDMRSAEILKKTLQERIKEGKISNQELNIYDARQAGYVEKGEVCKGEILTLNSYEYHICGKICAMKEKRMINGINKLHNRKVQNNERKKLRISRKGDRILDSQRKIITKLSNKQKSTEGKDNTDISE